LPPGGHLVTCDVDAEWAAIGRAHWDRAGVGGKIEQCLGPAIETLAELCKTQPGTFDLIFIDADKGNYGSYYEAALVLVRLGGLIALDNMLFRGLVADPQDNDARALPVGALNEKIKADARVEHVLLPVGDGMTIARRRA
jgi:predicted O-methyltransferase YrrM